MKKSNVCSTKLNNIKFTSMVHLVIINQAALIQIKGGNDPEGINGGILNIK